MHSAPPLPQQVEETMLKECEREVWVVDRIFPVLEGLLVLLQRAGDGSVGCCVERKKTGEAEGSKTWKMKIGETGACPLFMLSCLKCAHGGRGRRSRLFCSEQ